MGPQLATKISDLDGVKSLIETGKKWVPSQPWPLIEQMVTDLRKAIIWINKLQHAKKLRDEGGISEEVYQSELRAAGL